MQKQIKEAKMAEQAITLENLREILDEAAICMIHPMRGSIKAMIMSIFIP